MRIVVKVGDILDEDVDVLISTANVHLNLSGGINGAILQRGGMDIQDELKTHLHDLGKHWVPPGSVVRTGPGPLNVKHVLHAVAIDGFYGSSVELVSQVIVRGLTEAARLNGMTVALPALATGYGPLSMEEFARALREALARNYPGIEELRVVLRHRSDAETVAAGLNGTETVIGEA